MISFLNFIPSNIMSDPVQHKAFKYMDETEELIIEKLLNIYLTRFSYDGLPDEMQETIGPFNYLDAVLFFNPSGCFCKTSEWGVQYLPTTGAYKFNLVGRPIEWNAYGYNGFNKHFTYKDSVLMFNDNAATIPFCHLMYETRFMRTLDDTTRQNIRAQAQPFLIEGDEDVKKSMQAWYEQLSSYKPVIFTKPKNKRDPDPVETKVFQTGIEYQAKDLMDTYTEFFNRCLTYLGLSNIGIQDKRERLVTAEASANDVLIQSNYTGALHQREFAIDKANKMFGLHMQVKPTELKVLQAAISNEYSALIGHAEAGQPMGGKNNGNDSSAKI